MKVSSKASPSSSVVSVLLPSNLTVGTPAAQTFIVALSESTITVKRHNNLFFMIPSYYSLMLVMIPFSSTSNVTPHSAISAFAESKR